MLNLIGSLLPVGEKLIDKLIPDPQAKQKALKELKQMEQSGELARISAEHQNTADARARETKIAISEFAPTINKIIVPILALVIVFLTFGMMSAILFLDVDEGKTYEIALFLLGVLSSSLVSVLNYYFGSSTGSKEKSQELQEIMEKKEPKV
jgi:K+-sensing histidine kinase KdpD